MQQFNSVKEVMSHYDQRFIAVLNFTNWHPRTEDKRYEPNFLFIWRKKDKHVIHTYQKVDDVWLQRF